jgi:hypothetical protein
MVDGSSMIILQSYVYDIGTLHSPGHTPVSRHPNAILVAPRAFQAMKIQTGDVHLFRPFYNVEGIEDDYETVRNFSANPSSISVARVCEESLQSLVAKRLNHFFSVIN